MKRTILSVAVLIVLIINACTQGKGPQKSMGETAVVDSDTISYLEAKKYVANYEARAGIVKRVVPGEGRLKIDSLPDTRCIWFGIDRLKKLVDQIQQEKGDGIRFYLSTYDKQYVTGEKHPHDPPVIYWGYNTLIMVSTQYLDGHHVDYYSATPKQNRHGNGFIVMADPENRGELCPPPANCNKIGATLIEE